MELLFLEARRVFLGLMEGYCCSMKLIFSFVEALEPRFKLVRFSDCLFYLRLESSSGTTLVCGAMMLIVLLRLDSFGRVICSLEAVPFHFLICEGFSLPLVVLVLIEVEFAYLFHCLTMLLFFLLSRFLLMEFFWLRGLACLLMEASRA